MNFWSKIASFSNKIKRNEVKRVGIEERDKTSSKWWFVRDSLWGCVGGREEAEAIFLRDKATTDAQNIRGKQCSKHSHSYLTQVVMHPTPHLVFGNTKNKPLQMSPTITRNPSITTFISISLILGSKQSTTQ
ncbi:hypothetical protein AMTR_s00078p00109900 [Amborella trichopoda]|uniref:Uncharacterized protein n=1 Tax=Amborella trichopoda TaxID=13333 RepID=W1P884_AMBTC|nr:hypothetical protein AMTR_s00078p00109900 [Amborella trichopoda]